MANGLDSGGGVWGGAAQGLQAGFGMIRDLQRDQDERTYRQQQIGLQSRAADREDTESGLKVHAAKQAALDQEEQNIAGQTVGILSRHGITSADQAPTQEQLDAINSDPEMAELTQRHGVISKAKTDLSMSLLGPKVLAGVSQAKTDAKELSEGKTTPKDLGPDRFYNVMSLTGHPAIDFVAGPQGQGQGQGQPSEGGDEDQGAFNQPSVIGQHLDNFHSAASAGDWDAAHQHGGNLMLPYLSHQAPGDEGHFEGLNTPYGGDAEGDHGHITQAFHTIGALGTAHAALQSDPEAQKLILEAHKNGATENFQTAQQIIRAAGGIGGLSEFLKENDHAKEFKFVKSQLLAANPEMSDADATKQALDRTTKDPLAYLNAKYGFIADNTKATNESKERIAKTKAAGTVDAAGVRASAPGKASKHLIRGSDDQSYVFDAQSGKYDTPDGKLPPGVTATTSITGVAPSTTVTKTKDPATNSETTHVDRGPKKADKPAANPKVEDIRKSFGY